MKLPGRVVLVGVSLFALDSVQGADATTPVDYQRRHEPFAAGATVTPDKQTPSVNQTVQERRVEKATVEKPAAAVGERRAAIDSQAAREKTVLTKDSHRPDVVEQPVSAFNQQAAAISTADNRKPAMVAKYQDSLTAASATNMARFPALDARATAKINRFVFRKNPPESAVASGQPMVTPAGGPKTPRN